MHETGSGLLAIDTLMIIGVAEKILPGGEALMRADGQSVLVNNAVPGDVLELEMLGKRRGVLRADIVEVIEASDQRVQPPCPVAEACGGCALQFISSAQQTELKSIWVSHAFKALMDDTTDFSPVHADKIHHRRRLRWFVGHDVQGSFLGFYAPASHQLVRHAECMVATPQLNTVRQSIERHVDLAGVDSVQAVQLDDGMHLIFEADIRPDDVRLNTVEGMPLQCWWRDKNRITRPLHKPIQILHDVLPAGDMDVALVIGPDDFVQGQREGNRALIQQIQLWAGSANRIADLFCGIGNLSLPLAVATGAEVFGAELNPASVRAASANAKMLGLSSTFVAANLFEDFDQESYIGADVLILDPPRRGAKRICSHMAQLLPKKIIMVSCDVAAGARDGVLLRDQGYRLKALRALDLFPYAGHVEAMSLWVQA